MPSSSNSNRKKNKLFTTLVEGILKGDRRSLSRSISIIDNKDEGYQEIIKNIFTKTGNAFTIGLTGPGGAGKSSLIGKLIPEFQKLGYKIAIVAVDPTSHITGGAILGDRVRMQSEVIENSDVFMRSIASRGAVGGISHSLRNIIRILDSAGYNLIIVESVGAGQLEVEVSKVVNLTLVLFTPHTGDKIQAIKSGLTEIGDIYIVNKSDLEGANNIFNTLKDLIGETERKPLVLKSSTKNGKGVKELAVTIHKLMHEKKEKFKEKEKIMLDSELKDMVLTTLQEKILTMLKHNNKYERLLNSIIKKEIDPFIATEKISSWLFKSK